MIEMKGENYDFFCYQLFFNSKISNQLRFSLYEKN